MHGASSDLAHLDGIALAQQHHAGLAVSRTLHGTLRHQDGVLVEPLRRAHTHVHTRQQHALGVVELPSQGDLPGAAIHRDISEQQRALALDIGTIDAQRQRLVASAGNLALGDGRAQAQGVGSRLGEVGVHRIKLLDTR